MKAATLRQFLSAHSWMGLLAGMALFIAFYAGAINVFTHDLEQWPRPAAVQAPALPPEQAAQALADAVLARHPALAESYTLMLPGEGRTQPQLFAFGPAAEQAFGGMVQFQPGADGQPVQLPQRSGFVAFLYDLHFTAGLPRTFGTYLFGVVCLLYGVALVSGVVLYAPVLLKDLFALRRGRNVKRLWQDAHNAIGMLSLPFHVIFAWSGAVLTLGVLLLAPFQYLVFDDKLMQVLQPDFELAPHVQPAHVPAPMLPVAELVKRARAANPGFVPESLSFHDAGDANAQVELYGHQEQRRLNTLGGVALRAADGQVLRVLSPQTMSPGVAALRGLQTLHFGDYGRWPLQWLYFLLGLGGAFLFYSGNLLWVEARRKRRQVAQPLRTHVMARLTTGVCLGCVAGVSALFVAARLLPPGMERGAYYAVFALGVAWALLRPTARGAYELLLACAVLTVLVPLAGLRGAAGWVAPWSSGTLLAIDACALALAWAYWQMARAAYRRGQGGDPHSVWAFPPPR
ncbi:PepSY-associated TM helix domain-containing protein [Xanthomonas sp. LF06-19]|uniref:PepSY-associated TM helix domain-containing protein n=1 Tax=Xanthomonas sp. LF06-19 TaxID=3097551 RepID=UPI002A7F5B9E|nr:PepSY-associated TM helix domain-containing protein [Xanthomonas sp. LF06-19]MDY4285296.1 PepSY-associated TM helix domain-containing protein [Xanthomonas sp. LF06-19]